MNNWDIRQQIIALALLPVIVVAIGLTSYFTISQLDFLTASQTRHGNLIARQLAPVSEYAVFSGNIASLDTILKNILSDEDIISIKITDTNHKTITSLSDNEKTKIQNTIWHKLAFEELKVFKQPIKTQILNVGLLEDDNNNSNNNEETIGYIELTLTSTNINAKKLQTVIKGSLITLFILLMSMLLALRLSKQISKPVQTLTNTVKRISSGDYKIRIDEQAPGDLGTLESCVNIMTEELQYSRKHLEAKINEATKELHETMEELEIRNAELDIARSKALQTSQAKTEFLANMSHELRTPLGGILGFSELLEKTSLESQQRDYSDIIKKSAHNLLNIIDGVLDLSKIESGKLEINSSEFNVIDIIEEVIDLLTPIAYEKNLELFYYFDINASHIINSDPVRIRQILINLIGNAIKFTEKGFISLHISSYQEDDLSTIIKFSIKDTGIGMDQSQQERLFNAFTQADKSIERKFGGTGLGLVISKKLAQLLQGDISFESQKNSGTTFTLTLPTKTAKQIKPGTELAGKKICFIDPQCSCEKGIQSLLNFWACNVTSYNKIPDDLSNFDLIIVSICRISMSKEKIKSLIPLNNTNIPILAVVSTRSHKELINIKNYGFNDAVFRSSKQELIHQSLLNLVSDASPAEPEPTIAAHYFDWSELNILVVDDNDINLKLADIILTKNGARVITESTGQGGIDRSNEQFFDLIFMDLQMPDMDGYESSTHIRENKNNDDTIIIALTANAMASKEFHNFEKCGINDVLIKPVNESSIQNVIDKWLKKTATHKQQSSTRQEEELFSRSEALKLAADNIELANELTNMLIEELPSYLQSINDALAKHNIKQLRHDTHKLHGAARCCGTLALRQAAERLESDIDNNNSETLEPSSHQLIDEIERLINTDQSTFML